MFRNYNATAIIRTRGPQLPAGFQLADTYADDYLKLVYPGGVTVFPVVAGHIYVDQPCKNITLAKEAATRIKQAMEVVAKIAAEEVAALGAKEENGEEIELTGSEAEEMLQGIVKEASDVSSPSLSE